MDDPYTHEFSFSQYLAFLHVSSLAGSVVERGEESLSNAYRIYLTH